MGNKELITQEGLKAVNNADVIIGSERITEIAGEGKEIFNSYNPSEILEYIKKRNFKTVAVLVSGDTGFYSGAGKIANALKGYDISFIPGISSVAYFCAKLNMPYDDVKIISAHGKRKNVVGFINTNEKVFALLSGKDDIKKLCEKLCYYGLEDVILNIGQRLSYKDEKIIKAKAKDIKEYNFDSPLVVLIQNNKAKKYYGCVSDEEFIRGNVPMTKSEVRTISISKLDLFPNFILYDIGAGTGSISIEAALKDPDGEVFAIEKNKNALKLIEENKRRFAADNITVVEGEAPKALKELPAPTHIFIGGGSGNIGGILKAAFEKNPKVKIVINAVTLNTVAEVFNVLKEKNLKYNALCVNIAENKETGGYQLMMGKNPVYIFTVVNF